MNQTFDLHRFGLVLKLHLSEHIRTYLMGIGVLFGIWMIMLLPSAVKTAHFGEIMYSNHALSFTVVFCGAGAWFASEAFRMVSTPIQGIPYLTLPASRLEKYLVAFLMLLLFVPVSISVFYIVEGSCFSFINGRLPQSEPRYHLLDLSSDYIPIDFHYLWLMTPSFFLVGSIYFPRLPFIKTAVIAFVLFFFNTLFLNDLLIQKLFPAMERYGFTPFHDMHFLQNGLRYQLNLTGATKLLVNSILLLAAPTLWFVAYVRFNEKEL